MKRERLNSRINQNTPVRALIKTQFLKLIQLGIDYIVTIDVFRSTVSLDILLPLIQLNTVFVHIILRHINVAVGYVILQQRSVILLPVVNRIVPNDAKHIQLLHSLSRQVAALSSILLVNAKVVKPNS